MYLIDHYGCRKLIVWHLQIYLEVYIFDSHMTRSTGISMCVYDSLLSITITWAPSSEFVSSSIPSWQILTAHAQQFRRARDLVFCLKVPLDSMLVWASSGGSGETARMRRLAWTFAARIGDKYLIRLTRSTWSYPFKHTFKRQYSFCRQLVYTPYIWR